MSELFDQPCGSYLSATWSTSNSEYGIDLGDYMVDYRGAEIIEQEIMQNDSVVYGSGYVRCVRNL